MNTILSLPSHSDPFKGNYESIQNPSSRIGIGIKLLMRLK